MIKTESVSLRIGSKTLLEPLSVEFETGKLHLILGPNGAGKSTMIKLLSGQQKPTAGKVWYRDKELNSFRVAELARFRAVLSQSFDFAFPVKVSEVVMMGRYPHFTTHPKRSDHRVVKDAMDLFGIPDFAERDYTTLSGGERQRVQFARVMAQIWPEDDTHRILFLDEPLTYLDVKYQYDFLNKVRGFVTSQNLTVIGVLHDLNLAARFADRLILLKDGTLVAQGTPDQVLTPASIQKVYEMIPRVLSEDGYLRINF